MFRYEKWPLRKASTNSNQQGRSGGSNLRKGTGVCLLAPPEDYIGGVKYIGRGVGLSDKPRALACYILVSSHAFLILQAKGLGDMHIVYSTMWSWSFHTSYFLSYQFRHCHRKVLPAELTNLAVKLFSKGNGSDRSSEGEIEKKEKKGSFIQFRYGSFGWETGIVNRTSVLVSYGQHWHA